MAIRRRKGKGERASKGRLRQIGQSWTMTRKVDRKLPLVVGAVFLGVLAVLLLIGFAVGHPVYVGILAVPFALMAATAVFGRRAERAAYRQIEGQPGAALAVLKTLRRGWSVTEAVAASPNRDVSQTALVHRAVGRPGIVLVAEGPRSRSSHLLVQEKKKLGRILPDIPVFDFQVGTEDGQIPLGKLNRTIMKLPRNIRPAQAAEVQRRLKAMGTVSVPLPKGPLPKGARMPKMPRG